jgi:hypothetical protein
MAAGKATCCCSLRVGLQLRRALQLACSTRHVQSLGSRLQSQLQMLSAVTAVITHLGSALHSRCEPFAASNTTQAHFSRLLLLQQLLAFACASHHCTC